MGKIENTILVGVCILNLICCKPSMDYDQVKIEFKTFNKEQSKVSINSYSMLQFEKSIRSEVKVDSLGSAIIELDLLRPQMFYYEIDDLMGGLYLEPGYDLKISIENHSVNFRGRGSEINNYMKMVTSIQNEFSMINSTPFLLLSPPDFQKHFDSLKSTILDFHRNYLDSIELTKQEKIFIEAKNLTSLLALKMNYARINFQDTTSSELGNVTNEVLFDTSFLDKGVFEYSLVLDGYMDLKYYAPKRNKSNPSPVPSPASVHNEILYASYPDPFKELLAAKNILNWMLDHGITPSLDTVYNDFNNRFRSSLYALKLEESYKKWDEISEGNQAPDFTGTTPDGLNLSLSDLKGKIVYVDIWATWCKPCIEEFPHSIELQKKFTASDPIEFLYVSVDREQKLWEKFLTSNKNLKGLHVIQNGSILESYLNSGIPRYLLIDDKGKIVTAYAPRPSSEKIYDEIRNLLLKIHS